MKKWKEQLESGNELVRYKAKQFITIFESRQLIQEFDVDLFFKLVDKVVVYGNDRVAVGLLDGI